MDPRHYFLAVAACGLKYAVEASPSRLGSCSTSTEQMEVAIAFRSAGKLNFNSLSPNLRVSLRLGVLDSNSITRIRSIESTYIHLPECV